MSIKHYFHLPAIAAGFAAVLIGYSSSAVIVFQAGRAVGATSEQIGSWMIALGIGGSAIAALFSSFPSEFIFALAGLALLSTIANSLYTAVADDSRREAAVITFVVTASGLSLFGIGAAFWGLVAGVATLVFDKK